MKRRRGALSSVAKSIVESVKEDIENGSKAKCDDDEDKGEQREGKESSRRS